MSVNVIGLHQSSLFEQVETEFHRIFHTDNITGGLFSYDPQSSAERYDVISLAIETARGDDYRCVIPLGSFWVVPALLDTVRELKYEGFGPAVPWLLYALGEFWAG